VVTGLRGLWFEERRTPPTETPFTLVELD
jgi:hypothetical protein